MEGLWGFVMMAFSNLECKGAGCPCSLTCSSWESSVVMLRDPAVRDVNTWFYWLEGGGGFRELFPLHREASTESDAFRHFCSPLVFRGFWFASLMLVSGNWQRGCERLLPRCSPGSKQSDITGAASTFCHVMGQRCHYFRWYNFDWHTEPRTRGTVGQKPLFLF